MPPRPKKKAAAAASVVAPPSSVWAKPASTQTPRIETRSFGDLTFTVKRRSLTFTEEARIMARVVDPKTRRPDLLEMLALTTELAVTENDFDLTPRRVREDLPARPALAWFLINWLCEETIRNMSDGAKDGLTKKRGP